MAKTPHAKVSTDGLSVIAREEKDPAFVAERATMEALGKPFWLPIVTDPRPPFDRETEKAPVMVETIEAGRVHQSWNAPVPKTAQEIDDEKTAEADSRTNDIIAEVLRRTMATQLALTNDVRARHGDPPLTAQQYLNFWNNSANGFTLTQFKEVIKGLL